MIFRKNATNPTPCGSSETIAASYDPAANTRLWEGWQRKAVTVILAGFSLFCVTVTLFAAWLDQVRLTSFLGFALVLGYLVFPARKGAEKPNCMPWYDWLLMLLGAGAFFYFCFRAPELIGRLPMIYPYEVLLGICGILSLLELCRRSVGVPILCVAAVFLLYALFYFTRTLNFPDAVNALVCRLFYTTTGILTTPINVCSKYIVVFILFGAFLERSGIAEFFIRGANALAGSSSGGPAKVAVLSSALCGMVSGSSVGNTVTTGSVTIPMMKRTGYRGEFAGAVEAAASTGGQIMPPIMGAAAFLMADYLGIPYSSVILRAILPAALYFAGIFLCVHLEARRLGLRGTPRELLPKFRDLLKRSFLLLPLIVLLYLVSSNTKTMAYSAAIAILFAILAANMEKDPILGSIGCGALLAFLFLPVTGLLSVLLLITGAGCALFGMLRKKAVFTTAEFTGALASGAKSCVPVIAACGVAGIIAGCITMTGLASQIISVIIGAANAFPPFLRLFIALVLTMLCCIVLGMGVPTTANYCIMAATCAPILITLGVHPIAAHFFVFYFGIVADITPPVALAAYAGAAIARAEPMKTAITATKLAIAAFIVPYVFAMDPSLLLIDTTLPHVLLNSATAMLGIFGFSAALEGWLIAPLSLWKRALCILGGLTLLIPGLLTDAAGLAAIGAVTLLELRERRGISRRSAARNG